MVQIRNLVERFVWTTRSGVVDLSAAVLTFAASSSWTSEYPASGLQHVWVQASYAWPSW